MKEQLEQMLASLKAEHKQAEARYWEISGAINATQHWLKTWEEHSKPSGAPAEAVPVPKEE